MRFPVGQQFDSLGLDRSGFFVLQNGHFQHSRGPVVNRQKHTAVALTDDQIHLHIAHPLFIFDDRRSLLDVHPADDLAPSALDIAPFGIALALGAHMAVKLAAPLLVLPDELIDALVRDALNPFSGGIPEICSGL